MRTCDVYKSMFFKMDASFKTSVKARKLPSEQWNKDMFKTYDSYLQTLQTTDFSEKYVKKLLILYRRNVRNSKGCKKLQ